MLNEYPPNESEDNMDVADVMAAEEPSLNENQDDNYEEDDDVDQEVLNAVLQESAGEGGGQQSRLDLESFYALPRNTIDDMVSRDSLERFAREWELPTGRHHLHESMRDLYDRIHERIAEVMNPAPEQKINEPAAATLAPTGISGTEEANALQKEFPDMYVSWKRLCGRLPRTADETKFTALVVPDQYAASVRYGKTQTSFRLYGILSGEELMTLILASGTLTRYPPNEKQRVMTQLSAHSFSDQLFDPCTWDVRVDKILKHMRQLYA